METPEKLRCFGTFSGVDSNCCSRHSKNFIHVKLTGMNSSFYILHHVKTTVYSSIFYMNIIFAVSGATIIVHTVKCTGTT